MDMQKEPAILIGALSAFITGVAGVLIAFGIDFSQQQQDAIIACVASFVMLIFIIAGLIRQFVWSPDSVQKLVNKAEQAGATNTPAPPVVP